MQRNALHIAAVAGLALLGLTAVPAVAQPGRTGMIALQVNVNAGGGEKTYGVRPDAETIPLAAGQSARLTLVGTAIVNNVGVERPVKARFFIAAGSGNIELGESGPTWVNVRAKGNGTAQVGYEVNDGAYNLKEAFRNGRITLQISGGRGDRGDRDTPLERPRPDRPDRPDRPEIGRPDRYQAAQNIVRVLYKAILREDDIRSRRAEDDIQFIARGGYSAIQKVAGNLARLAESSGVFEHRSAEQVTGQLYRGLLRRDLSDREMAERDSGFRENIHLLRDRGLPALVQVLVGSREFQDAHDLDRNGLMGSGRDERRPGDRHR